MANNFGEVIPCVAALAGRRCGRLGFLPGGGGAHTANKFGEVIPSGAGWAVRPPGSGLAGLGHVRRWGSAEPWKLRRRFSWAARPWKLRRRFSWAALPWKLRRRFSWSICSIPAQAHTPAVNFGLVGLSLTFQGWI